MELKIYIANLGKYNEGILKGEWFTLPVDMDEVFQAIFDESELDENGQPHGDYAIHDYELPFNIGEHENIDKLNEIAEQIGDTESLAELLELLSGNEKYNTDELGRLAMNAFSELEIDHEIVDDDFINENIKNSDRGWEGIKIFLSHANINNEYHILDGYENIDELNHTYVSNVLSDFFDELKR